MLDCENCKHRDVWTYAEPCSKCHDLSEWEEEKQTNADRVRAMTDEELAEWVTQLFWSCDHCPLDRDFNKSVWLEWLKQEVESDA